MAVTPKKRALVVRNFTDKGTEESFAKDATPLLDAGAFANYEAAGLVTTAPAVTSAAKPKAATKPKPQPKAPTPATPDPDPAEQPDMSHIDDITASAD